MTAYTTLSYTVGLSLPPPSTFQTDAPFQLSTTVNSTAVNEADPGELILLPSSENGTFHAELCNTTIPDISTYDETFTTPEHVIFTTYLMIIIVVGLSANSFVVYASLKYASFNLDKVTIMFLRHLAVTDLLMVIFTGIPMVFVHMTRPRGNPFERFDWLCTVLGYLYEILVHSHIMFYLVIAAHRFVRCVFPFRLQTMSMNQGRCCCALIWIVGILLFATSPWIFHWAGGSHSERDYHVTFSMGMAMCGTATQNKIWWWFNICYTIILMFLIMILNLATLCFSAYINGKANIKSRHVTQARVTVSTMSLCALLSNFWAPYLFVRMILGNVSITDDSFGMKTLSHLPVITALVNPLIYTIVNRRFKKFLIKEFSRTKRGMMRGSQMRAMRRRAVSFKDRGQHFYSGVRHSIAGLGNSNRQLVIMQNKNARRHTTATDIDNSNVKLNA